MLSLFGRRCVRPVSGPHRGPPPLEDLSSFNSLLPLMEYFTHLSKQLNGAPTDVRGGASWTATGRRILHPGGHFCVILCVCV